eukprot:6725188-Alexandrium_andersonii.AAC.1
MRGASYGHSAVGPVLAGVGAPSPPTADRGKEGLAAAEERGPFPRAPAPEAEAPCDGAACRGVASPPFGLMSPGPVWPKRRPGQFHPEQG